MVLRIVTRVCGTWLALSVLAFVGSCAVPAPRNAESTITETQALAAFARLYGYIRYFYPGDEAAATDWDSFAIYGVDRVRTVRSDRDLEKVLKELFQPIAPAVCISRDGGRDCPPLPPLGSQNTQSVYWQHYGAGLGETSTFYRSVRTNRLPRGGTTPATAFQQLPVDEIRGKDVRLRAYVKVEEGREDTNAQLWIGADRPSGLTPAYKNMHEQPIVSPAWKQYEVILTVPADATQVSVGILCRGEGKVWLDDVELTGSQGDQSWKPLNLKNPGFESAESLSGWALPSRDYAYDLDTENQHDGRAALKVSAKPVSELQFGTVVEPGSVVERVLDPATTIRFPLVLEADAVGTLPHGDAKSLSELRQALATNSGPFPDASDMRVRLADIVITWNVFQHFYPYFDVVHVDWGRELESALSLALSSRDADEFVDVMKRLLAVAEDGHASVQNKNFKRRFFLPFQVSRIEGRVLVTRSDDPNVSPGDEVVGLGSRAVADILAGDQELISGSIQWKLASSLMLLGASSTQEPTEVGLVRDGTKMSVTVPLRTSPYFPQRAGRPIAEIQPHIWYVDLTRASMAEITAEMASISKAQGVILDLRGYPKSNSDILRYLIDRPDSSRWMYVPEIARPDREGPIKYDTLGWDLAPAQPHITGKAVLLTDATAISYAESIAGYFSDGLIGTIIGAPTAGTNGNVRKVDLPGGLSIRFTGMRVLAHSGAQQHLLGVAPHLPVERTALGVKEGKDEVLEAGLRFLSGSVEHQ